MKYNLVIFDMDGTILNTLEDLTDSVNYALSNSGYPKRTITEIKSFVGNGIRKLIDRAVPDGTAPEDADRVYNTFTGYYKIHCADKTKPYEGIPKLLESLRNSGCKTAVVSNKADYAVQELCRQYFDNMFDTAIGDRKGIQKKPAPDSVYEVLLRLDVKKEKAVYIGDSDVDIETALNAGMDCIIADWGFREREFLISKGAQTIVSSPEEILKLIY